MRRLVARALTMIRVGRRVGVRIGVAAAVVGLFGSACASSPDKLSYIAVPHPDDEMQAWSLIQDSPDIYKVFIVMTKGEQTGFCDSPGFDEGTGEAPPFPWPRGKWTPSCEAARQNSFFDFMTGMASRDNGLPSSFAFEGVKGPFDSLGHAICRHDEGGCISDLTAEVWTSSAAAVVWFNLGDGDLTTEEVEWAIATVRDNRSALGIDSSLPDHNLIGASFWNIGHRDCFIYEHDDHYAVQEALWRTDFGVGHQLGASCQSDPDVSRDEQVSQRLFDAAFETAEWVRVGQHVVHYGWLWSDHPGYWAGDYTGQDELFHRRQWFWVQYGDS